jgi:hypothetical protein
MYCTYNANSSLLTGLQQDGVLESFTLDFLSGMASYSFSDDFFQYLDLSGAAGVGATNNFTAAIGVIVIGGGATISTPVLIAAGTIAVAVTAGYIIYQYGREWKREAETLRNAERIYQEDCGKPFPRDKRQKRHDEIEKEKKNSDGVLDTQRILTIMFELEPCD